MNLTNEDLKEFLQEHNQQRQDLIKRCQNRDRQAFNQCIQNYQDSIFSHVRQMVGDDQEAYNIIRNVFVTAYTTISEFHGETSLDVWLFKIAERQIQRALDKRKTWYERIFPKHLSEQRQEQETSPEYVREPKESVCRETDKLLIQYIDGELTELESRRVEKHLKDCARCRQEFEKFRKTDILLRFHSQLHAPPDLRFQINAAIDAIQTDQMKPFWQKISDLCPLSAAQIAAITASIVMIFSAMSYYDQYQQLQSMEKLLQQNKAGYRASADPSQKIIGGKFVIVTGKMVAEEMSLEEARFVAGMTSEPEKTDTLFIPGGIEKIGTQLEQRIDAMRWQVREDQTYREDHFTIRKILAESPENSTSSFAQFLERLKDDPEGQTPAPDITMTSIEIYLIEKQ